MVAQILLIGEVEMTDGILPLILIQVQKMAYIAIYRPAMNHVSTQTPGPRAILIGLEVAFKHAQLVSMQDRHNRSRTTPILGFS
jgi:hypothetical protein